MEPDRLHKRYTRAIKTKRSAPYIIYPEILVIVDYDGYRLHGGDNLQVKTCNHLYYKIGECDF